MNRNVYSENELLSILRTSRMIQREDYREINEMARDAN